MKTKKITKLDSKKNNKNSTAVQENKKPAYRHFIDLSLLTEKEVKEILDLASDIKKNQQKYLQALQNKNLMMIFEKPSTRTRVSFEVAINQLGGCLKTSINWQTMTKQSIFFGEFHYFGIYLKRF